FDSKHRISKQITSYSADDVFGPGAAISALPVPAILKLPSSIISKYDMLLVFVTDDARSRVGELAAARQDQLKECAVALEPNDTTTNNAAAFLYGSPGCTIQSIPKTFDFRMRLAPAADERFNFVIGELIRKFSKRINPASITKSKIARFANATL